MPSGGAPRGPRAVHPRQRDKFSRLTHKGGQEEAGEALRKVFLQSLMTEELLWPVGHTAQLNDCRAKKESLCRSVAQVYRRRRGSGWSCCFQSNTAMLRSDSHPAVRGTSSTANARFQFPHQSVTAPRWAEGCYYCKQRPCCFIWLSEASRENPDLGGFINQKRGISSFSNENLVLVWFMNLKSIFFLNPKDDQKDCQWENVTKAQHCFSNRGDEPANH